MKYELCEKVRDLEPYEPITGEYPVRLDANESFFPMPQTLRNTFKEIVDTLDFNRYPDPMAKELVKAFADYYEIDPDHITATNGSDEMLYLLASAMLTKGSKVVVAEPDFSMYRFYSFLSENQVIAYQKNEMMQINVDKLIQTVSDNHADMVIFSNPCNPTGQGITAEDARKLVNSVSALVVLDEAYMDFWDQSILKEAADYDNLIVLKTASKAVGAAAVRLGFAVANRTITNALRAVKSPYNVNSVTQAFGTAIYREKDLLRQRCQKIIDQTSALYQSLLKLNSTYHLDFDITEPCANFVFIRTPFAEKIFRYLLSKGIAVRYFGSAGALRITAGNEEENAAFLGALEQYVLENELTENLSKNR